MAVTLVSETVVNRDVRNQMKMLDISFQKTEQYQTDLKIQKPKT